MSTTNSRQPAIYIPHGGGPWPYMEDPSGQYDSLSAYLSQIPDSLPQTPDAIAIVSAHWEAPNFSIASGPQPELIYDFGGFPPHTYEAKYPAPGAPDVAALVHELATAAGIEATLDPTYGWDHGVFVPLSVSWPNADVPVVAISLKAGLDPAEHHAFGAAIEGLRDHNVVIIGSGLSTHDLSFRISRAQADEFDTWVGQTMMLPVAERASALDRWASAPSGRAAHPREEHLLPLMVVSGAGGNDTATRSYRDDLFGLPATAFRFDR